MADHALLSASGSKKWLACPPSARLEEQFPDEISSYAAEGTKAHELCEIIGREQFFGEARPDLDTPEKLAAAGYTGEMLEAARLFVRKCLDLVRPLQDAGEPYTVLLEQKLDYSAWAPKGFGTGDFVLVSKRKVWVRDFKYGQGVRVEAEGNSQMMYYGLGAYDELSFAYEDIETFDIGIEQPRINASSSWEVSLADLLTWGKQNLPVAQLAFAGQGEFCPGDHCSSGFCRARFTCKARAEANLQLATQEFGDLPDSSLLDPVQIAALLPKLSAIATWANEVQDYALKQAVDNNVRFPGFKLVEGRSNRFIAEPKTAAVRLVANGVPQEKIFSEPKLLGITALETLVGKKKFEELLGDLLRKPPGKPALVAVSDKRSEWQPNATAEEDFT